MLKVWIPFWKFRTEKVETWLSQMAARGHHLAKISGWGTFYFRTGEPQTIIYGIGVNVHSIPQALVMNGWEQVLRHGSWYIVSNAKPRNEIKVFPNCEQYRTNGLHFLNRISLTTQISYGSCYSPSGCWPPSPNPT